MEKKRLALRKLLEAVEKEILRKPDKKTLDRLSLLAGFQRKKMDFNEYNCYIIRIGEKKILNYYLNMADNNHVYFSGEPYPRKGHTPGEDRIAELAGSKNKLGYPLIVKTTDTPEEAHERVLEVPVESGTSENSPKPTEAKRTPKEARGKASKTK